MNNLINLFISGTDYEYSSWKESTTDSQFLVTRNNGFLPKQHPLCELPPEFASLESLLKRMPLIRYDRQPGLLYHGKLGEAVRKELTVIPVDHITDTALLTALFRDYSFLASAYLLEPCDITRRNRNELGTGRATLPSSIAVPLTKISEKLGSRPFMEYAQSYALYNYKVKKVTKPFSFNNIEILRTFTGMKNEAGFISVHIDMTGNTGQLVKMVIRALDSIDLQEREHFDTSMAHLVKLMEKINRSMEKMWKESSPSEYINFRTFIMGIRDQKEIFPNGVVYEGVSDEPRFYRGASAANDNIVPTIDNLLQLTEKMPENEMTEILRDFRSYRPEDHSRWLRWVEESSRGLRFTEYVKGGNDSLKLYILLLDQVREFRSRHWNLAKEYIIKRTAYPQATGGSPMDTFLPNQLMAVLLELESSCKYLMKNRGTLGDVVQKISDTTTLQRIRLKSEVDLFKRNSIKRNSIKRNLVKMTVEKNAKL